MIDWQVHTDITKNIRNFFGIVQNIGPKQDLGSAYKVDWQLDWQNSSKEIVKNSHPIRILKGWFYSMAGRISTSNLQEKKCEKICKWHKNDGGIDSDKGKDSPIKSYRKSVK